MDLNKLITGKTVYAVRPFWGNYETFLARVLLVDNTNYIQPFTRILLTCGRPNPMMPYCLYRIVRNKADDQKRPFKGYSQTTRPTQVGTRYTHAIL